MSKLQFLRLPFAVADLSLPKISAADVEQYVPYEVESSPYEHWILKGAGSSLVGLKNGRALTPQSTLPIYQPGYVDITSEIGKALLTDMTDAAAQTLVLIMKRPTLPVNSEVQIIGGAIDTVGSGVTSTGSGMYAQGTTPTSLTLNIRGGSGLLLTNTPGAVGDWMMAAFAEQSDATALSGTSYAGGASTNKTTSWAGTSKRVSTRKIAVGNGYYGSGMITTLSLAEVILYDRALSVAELDAVYARAKARMESRGLTLA